MDNEKHNLHTQLLTRIADQVKETQECVNKLDKKLDLNIQKLEYQVKEINKLDEQQNASLAEHIDGVNTLKDMYVSMEKHFDTRVSKLEEPRKWLNTTKNIILWISGLGGAIFAIVKVLQALHLV